VRGRVHKPCKVEHNAVSQATGHEESIPKLFTPEVRRNLSGEDKAHVQWQPRVHLLLEHDDRISLQIVKTKVATGFDYTVMLLNIEPSHVSEKESAGGIVGVGVSLAVLVVDTVVAGPVKDRALIGDAVAHHKETSDEDVGLIRTMRPQSVDTNSYTESTDWPQNERPQEGLSFAVENREQSNGGDNMHETDVNTHWPVDGLVFVVMSNHPWN